MIDPIGGEELGMLGAATNGRNGTVTMSVELGTSLLLRMNRLEQQISEVNAKNAAAIAQLSAHLDRKFKTMNNNIRCFGAQLKAVF
jgi:hypothetical protein